MSKSRAKGTMFETLVLQCVKNFYPPAHRNPLAGQKDVGDIWTGDDRFILECKNVANGSMPQFLREARAEAHNLNDHAVGVVVTKRRGSMDPNAQLVTMELADFLELVCVLSEPSKVAW